MVDWIKVVPETGGPGTSKLEISARPNTGRNERSTILKFVNNHVIKELHVTQMGSEEYVSFCGIREIVVEASASDIMVWGVTNSSRLTFSLAGRSVEGYAKVNLTGWWESSDVSFDKDKGVNYSFKELQKFISPILAADPFKSL